MHNIKKQLESTIDNFSVDINDREVNKIKVERLCNALKLAVQVIRTTTPSDNYRAFQDLQNLLDGEEN